MIYIKNDCLDPYFNLSLEEYLFENDNLDDFYFWLWQNDNTIVIGKNQNAYEEINLEYVKENNIKVSRRMTGGGAVYHDMGNINFTFIFPKSGEEKVDFKKFTDPIKKALSSFGIAAEYSGRNDLLIDGKKFSGNAQYVGKNKIIHHGTLIYSSDLSKIGKSLTPPKEKLKSHGVSSTKSRVTTISEYLPERISLELFQKKLLQYIFEEYENVKIENLSEDDIKNVNKLKDEKYGTFNWIFGNSPEFNYSKTERIPDCGSINVSMNINSEIIENIKIFGDFFENGNLTDLENSLCGIKYEIKEVKNQLNKINIGNIINNLTENKFLEIMF